MGGHTLVPTPSAPRAESVDDLAREIARLQQRENHLLRLLDSARDAVLAMSEDGLVTDWNPSAERLLGWTAEEALGQRLAELIIPHQHRDAHEAGLKRYITTGRSTILNTLVEVEALRRDGSVFPAELSVWAIGEGASQGFGAFLRDITERKHLEASFKTTLEERETILRNSVVGIAFLSPDGRFKWANQAMLDLFGANEETHLQSMESVYLDRNQYLRVGGEVAQTIARGGSYETELQMRRLDGRTIWVSLSGKAVSQRDLSQGTVWVVTDITRRKELEEALSRTSSEREAILNTALVGIIHNLNRKVVWVNQKYAEMSGYRPEELIGQSTRIFYDSDEAFEADATTTEILRRDGVFSCERQIRRNNGEMLWVMLAGRCVTDRQPEVGGVIWTMLDITERKRAEEDIRLALAQQKELNQLRSQFISMTSHEFRTPLATILSSAELLKFYADRMDESERLALLDSVENCVKRMTHMLDRVLLIGKSDADMLDFAPAPLHLPSLCASVVDEVRAQHPDTTCTLVTSVDPDLGEGHFDGKLLRHILSNLLSNAIKYSPEGGEVSFRVQRNGPRTQFEISDQGIGIPKDEIPHLFESFHRASNVGNIQGTGLGLAIVKRSVHRHGGTIEVDSNVGKGTRFVVRI